MLESGMEREEFVASEAERKRKLEERRQRAAEAEEDEEPSPPDLGSVPPRKRGKKEAEHQASAAAAGAAVAMAAAAAAASRPGKAGKAGKAKGGDGGGGKRRRESGGGAAEDGGGARAGKPPKLGDTPHRESMRKVLNAVASCTGARGYKIAELFLRLPTAAEVPGYYDLVTSPISIAQMRERLGSEPDYSFAQLDADMDLMVANAHLYNDPATQVYVDANTLLDKYHKAKAKHAPEVA